MNRSLLHSIALFGTLSLAGLLISACTGSNSATVKEEAPAAVLMPEPIPLPLPFPESTPTEPVSPKDTAAPYVTNTSPKLGSKGAGTTSSVIVQLSEPIDTNSVSVNSLLVVDGIGNTVSGTVNLDALKLSIIFSPNQAFSDNEIYTATLKSSVSDMAGNRLPYDYNWSFLVGTPPSGPQDLKPPFVVETNPALGDVTTALSPTISAKFNEALAESTITTNSVLVKNSENTTVNGTVALTPDGTTIQFTPSAPLKDIETYVVTLTSTITDKVGNPLLYDYQYSFKTAPTKTIAVSSGTATFLVLQENGTVWGWGQNNFGQIGDGTEINRNIPTRAKIDNVISIAQGETFSIALKKDGTVWAWGDNLHGQLGHDSYSLQLEPKQIEGLENIKQVGAMRLTAFALKEDGTLWAWGQNTAGQLGNGTMIPGTVTPHPIPSQVNIPGTIIKFATGGSAAAALVQSDPENPKATTVWIWGNNSLGQLGDGTKTHSPTPKQVLLDGQPFLNVKHLSAGFISFAAITYDNELYTWGGNRYGQIGNPKLAIGTSNTTTPPYLALQNVASVFMGPAAQSIMAQKTDGSLWGWGEDAYGQLATSILQLTQTTPLKLGSIANMKDIAMTGKSTVFLASNGTLYTAGYNLEGQLGDKSATFVNEHPYYIPSIGKLKGMSGTTSLYNNTYDGNPGHDNALILDIDGGVWGWGGNQFCEMAITNQANQTEAIMSPTQIAPTILKNITQVSRGLRHALALDESKHVWAWGHNGSGQLGRSTTSAYECTPTLVTMADGTPLENITYIAAAHDSSFAIQTDANGNTTVYGWGYNGDGGANLGLGSADKALKKNPVLIPALSGVGKIIKLGSGGNHQLALTENGQIYGWGLNSIYQAGNSKSTSPVRIPTLITTDIDNNPLGKITDICTGIFHSMALREDGIVMAWGLNPGYLGTAIKTAPQAPAPVLNITDTNNASKVVRIECNGGRSNLALTADHRVWAWGPNDVGQMGQGNTVFYRSPQLIPKSDHSGPLNDVIDISYNSLIRSNDSFWKLGFIPSKYPDKKPYLVDVIWP